MKKRFLSVLLCLIMALGLLPTAAFAEDTEPLTITSVNMKIAEPKVGEKVSFEPTYESTPADSVETLRASDGELLVAWSRATTEQYRTLGKSAFKSDLAEDVNPGEEFQPGYCYRVDVFAQPKAGYKMIEQTELTVNGKEPSVGAYTNTYNNTYLFTHIFEPLAPGTVDSIAATITAPAVGATPDTNPTLESTPANGVTPGTVYWFKIAKDVYTGGSTDPWEQMTASETFDMDHLYKVNISAAAKSGVTFQSSVSGTVNGEECTVTDLFGQGKVLSYVFEAKQPATITSVDVQIPAPKVGDTVSFTAAYVSTPANSVEQYYNGSSPALFWYKLSEADFDIDYLQDYLDSVKVQNIVNSWIRLSDGETFQAGYYYYFECYAKPSGQLTFTDSPKITLNGGTPQYGRGAVYKNPDIGDQISVTEWFYLPGTVDSIAATITAPTVGVTPDTNPTLESTPANGVTPGTVYWFKIAKDVYTGGSTDPWEAMAASETFDMDHLYKVNLSASLKSGFSFASSVSGTVNEKQCDVIDLFGQGKVLSYVFKDVQPATITAVDLVIPAPKVGKTVSFEPTYKSTPADSVQTARTGDGTLWCHWVRVTTEQYRTMGESAFSNGDIVERVNPSDEFQPGYCYAVSVIAVSKAGYKVVEQTELTVNGKKPNFGAYTNTNNNTYLFTHIFEPLASAPAYPELDEISNLYKIKIGVLCAQETEHNKLYGLIDGGVSSDGTVKMNDDGVYEITLTVNPSAYLKQFNTDTKRTHEFVDLKVLEDVESRTITVRYDSKTMTWSAVPNHEDRVEIGFFVRCEAPAAEYTVTLSGTGAGASGAGSYAVGTEVNIYAGTMSGYSFNGWTTTSTDVTILSASSKNASFVMPSHDVEVKANWIYNGGGGGGGYAYYTINATAGAGGSISPFGSVSVRAWQDKTFTITPDRGYAVSNVKIDGKSIGAVRSYTFENVRDNHTIEAVFMKANGNPQTGVFVDVPEGSYYEEAVSWAVENGITRGTAAAHFSPDGICTRAQAVTFLWRAAGSPAPKTTTMPFTDVPAGSYYYDAVLWAVENGITKGTSATEFSPDMNCSRAQIVTFLWRSEQSPAAGTVNPFTDVKPDAYYADAVLWAVKEDITKGTTDTMFSPDADCTRAQIVTFLWRALAK